MSRSLGLRDLGGYENSAQHCREEQWGWSGERLTPQHKWQNISNTVLEMGKG